VYTASASDVPAAWEESEPRLIATGAAADVKLRSFTTRVHRVDAMVSYRMDD
jgi:mitotic spindle assembly checkpoint protein MAD2